MWKYGCTLSLEGYRCEELCIFSTQIQFELSGVFAWLLERHSNPRGGDFHWYVTGGGSDTVNF